MAISSRTRVVGILTSGGDCPGLNAAIRGIVKPAISTYHIEVIGIEKGFRGLVENHSRVLHLHDVSNILTVGGTILGTSREKPHRMPLPHGKTVDLTARAVETYHRLGLDCLICLGGNGTHKVAYSLMQQGLNIIGLPKTIDNDLVETDNTFGHDSAVTTAAEAIDRLHSTAEAHQRVLLIELMGHKTGWLALAAGLAGGADVVLIPEIPYDLDSICQSLIERRRRGKWFSIVAVAEGSLSQEQARLEAAEAAAASIPDPERKEKKKKKKKKEGNELALGTGDYRPATPLEKLVSDPPAVAVAHAISQRLGIETRVTVLGHLQRGGTPSAYDRNLATRFGTHAADMLAAGQFNQMVSLRGADVTSVPIEEVAGRLKRVPLDHPLLCTARAVGTNFGD